MSKKMNREQRNKLMVRVICIALAVVMVGGIILAAILS